MTTLLVSLVDAAIVLGIGMAVVMLMRRCAASLRHAVLAAVIACALAMPLFELVLPQVPVIGWSGPAMWSSGAILSSEAASSTFTNVPAPIPSRPQISWLQLFVAVWLTGTIVLGIVLLASFVRLRGLLRRCDPVTGHWRELTDELAWHCGVDRQREIAAEPQSVAVDHLRAGPSRDRPSGRRGVVARAIAAARCFATNSRTSGAMTRPCRSLAKCSASSSGSIPSCGWPAAACARKVNTRATTTVLREVSRRPTTPRTCSTSHENSRAVTRCGCRPPPSRSLRLWKGESSPCCNNTETARRSGAEDGHSRPSPHSAISVPLASAGFGGDARAGGDGLAGARRDAGGPRRATTRADGQRR